MSNKLTTPKSILIGSLIIAGSILYTNGFNFSIVPEVKADYHWADSSHDHYDYADESHSHSDYADSSHSHSDYADESHGHSSYTDESDVQSIIEDCSVDGESISC
jgi:hypothetical protein